MKILFYTPINFQCRDVASLLFELKKNGHQTILLSQIEKGSFHSFLEESNIPTYSYVSHNKFRPFKIIDQILHLIYFCWKHKVDVIISHLEPTNFVSVLSQYFIRSRVIISRHHLDLAHLSNFDTTFTYRLTYQLAKTIITVSLRSKQYMSAIENINPKKIHHINLGYDFSLYPDVNRQHVASIKQKYDADILLITVGRLDQFKRPQISVQVLEALIFTYSLKAKLIFLGNGELIAELKEEAKRKKLLNYVFFPGFVENVMEFLAAADFLLHPSISESSCVTVKEAALVDLPVIVCKNIGDFDDYLVNQKNSFVVNRETIVKEATDVIVKNYQDTRKLKEITDSLKADILKRFSIENVIASYSKLILNE